MKNLLQLPTKTLFHIFWLPSYAGLLSFLLIFILKAIGFSFGTYFFISVFILLALFSVLISITWDFALGKALFIKTILNEARSTLLFNIYVLCVLAPLVIIPLFIYSLINFKLSTSYGKIIFILLILLVIVIKGFRGYFLFKRLSILEGADRLTFKEKVTGAYQFAHFQFNINHLYPRIKYALSKEN